MISGYTKVVEALGHLDKRVEIAKHLESLVRQMQITDLACSEEVIDFRY